MAQSEVQAEILADAEVIIGVPIKCRLIAVIDIRTDPAFRQLVRDRIIEVQFEAAVFVVTARTLGKVLGRNVLAAFSTELESMAAPCPGQVVDKLIRILDRALRTDRIRPQLKIQVEKLKIGELVKAGERERADQNLLIKPIEPDTDFVRQHGREGVILI